MMSRYRFGSIAYAQPNGWRVMQPTLRRQLMDQEKELGITLVLRGKKELMLTNDCLFFGSVSRILWNLQIVRFG